MTFNLLVIIIAILILFDFSWLQEDPCLEYEAGTNHCKNCSSDYRFALINESTTLCASTDMTTCWLDHPFYSTDPAFNQSFQFVTTHTTEKQYCFNCTSFFALPSGENLCYSGCPKFREQQFIFQMSTDFQSLGCDVCALQNYQMQTVLDYSFIDLYDPEIEKCVSCLDRYSKCSSCNDKECLIHVYQYYQGHRFYNYTSRAYDLDMVNFYLCGLNEMSMSASNDCILSNMDHCMQGWLQNDLEMEICIVCKPIYVTNIFSCDIKDGKKTEFTYFIKSGAEYNSTEDLSIKYLENSGDSPSSPYFFLSQAIQRVIYDGTKKYIFQNATVYLGKGDHFFFYCNLLSGTIPHAPGIVQYCESYSDYLDQEVFDYDYFKFYFKPLYCSIGNELGYEDDKDFLEMCIVEGVDPNPTIYVNQAYAYFEVYNFARFENIHFSGINQLVQPVIQNTDLSTLPLKYCRVIEEPKIGDQILKLEKIYYENFQVNYKCIDKNYTGSTFPESSDSVLTCSRNKGMQRYEEQESTLTASGEPNHYLYFTKQQYNMDNQVQPRRINTLFNLMAMGEYRSYENTPPELEIVNCTFEYFLQSYESLISVQTMEFYSLEHGQVSGWEKFKNVYTFVTSNVAERGAKIRVQNSTFKHSKFSKGLISYRKQPYVSNEVFGYGNLSYYFMDKYPYVHDAGSYIIIENSHFYNLNSGFQNISALALYGGQEVMRTFHLTGNSQSYQGYLHKGTVINVEDFGGFIEIVNSTFEYNMHMIPQIYNGPQHTSSKKSYADFADSSQTKELKMAICDEDTQTDRYFLSHGIQEQDDIDSFYNAFERLSTIYTSRNRGSIVIKDCKFHSNVGTFGGALSINSQDWDEGDNPYVIIQNNNFTNNMAYLSGNALYIRNSFKDPNDRKVCGGITLINNTFQGNVGGSHHSNGGAASISCYLVTSDLQQDYKSSSTQTITDGENFEDQMIEFTHPFSQEKQWIYQYSVNIENNTFLENLAGSKGTALHLRYINSIRISNCTFTQNGPLLSQLEYDKSPYVRYLSKRSLAFLHSACASEFDYVSDCMQELMTNIQWSHAKGAVFVEHCQSEHCLKNSTIMSFLIEDSLFDDNQIGYVMDSNFPINSSSQITIAGGLNNTIKNCQFNNGKGLYSSFLPQKLKDYFPSDYYTYQQSSLITITLQSELEVQHEFQTRILNCSFESNKHFQTLGLGEEKEFFGSLINIQSLTKNLSSQSMLILNIRESEFRGNTFLGENTQLIYSQNALLMIEECSFEQNGGEASGKTMNTELELSSSYFQYGTYPKVFFQDYGLFYMEGMQQFPSKYTHYFKGNRFKSMFSQRGSILYLNAGNQNVHMTGNTYSNNIAISGGIISAEGKFSSNLVDINSYVDTDIVSTTFLIENENFANQISFEGIFSFRPSNLNENKNLNLFVVNSSFTDNFQFDSYSLLSIRNLRKVFIQNCSFSIHKNPDLIKSQFLEALTITYKNMFLNLVNNVFNEQRDVYFAGSKFLSISETVNAKESIYFKGNELPMSELYFEHAEIIDCSFENFYSVQSGVLVTITSNSKMVIRNSIENSFQIKNCSVNQNGIIYVEKSDFVGINLDIRDSHSVQTTQGSSSQIYNSYFLNNYAETYGMAYITGSSNFLCDHCYFINNSVAIDSSILYADNNPNGFIAIKNSTFMLNNASSNLMSLVSTRTVIEDSQFIDNFAQLINNGLTTINSEVTLKNVLVNYTDPEYILNNKFEVDTCFLNINFQSTLTLDSTLIQHCRGGTAAILQASGHSSVYIKNQSKFLDNKSSVDGSGSSMYFSTTKEVVIENSHFSGNGIIDVYIIRSEATIVNSTFEMGQNQFIYAQASAISILRSTFKDSQNLELYGQGLYCYCSRLEVTNSVFQNLSAVKGGAVYLTSQTFDAEFIIDSNTFAQNSAQQGGAIYIQDAPVLRLSKNLFYNNSVQVIEPESELSSTLIPKGLGGSLFFSCSNLQAKLQNNCSFLIEEENQFLANKASHDGGAIFRVSNEYSSDETNLFEGNEAPYGHDVATYPAYLEVVFVSNNDYYDPVNHFSRRLSQQQIHFDKIVSGISFSFLVFIKDQDGNAYYTDNESTATLKNSDSTVDILLNGNEINAVNGIFNFSSVTAITTPGKQVTLELEVSGMQSFGNSIQFLKEPLQFTISFRNCVSGEQMQNLACEECPFGTYLYEAPTENVNCKECQEEAHCAGKNIVYPLSGYWRENNSSEDWIQCPRVFSCLEGNKDNLTGHCDDGYTGKVCGECMSGFSKVGDFQCAQCPSKVGNSLKITVILLVLIVVVTGLVYSTINSSQKAKSGASVYIKILTSHLQIISALSNVKFSWPAKIKSFYDSMVAISKTSDQILSFDCFLEDTNISSNLGVYFTKLLLYGLLPLILAFADLLFWLMLSCCKQNFSKFQQKFVSTLVILLFLVHPTITQEMFQAFNCVQIGDKYYLRDDVRYECYTGQHLKFIIILIIPSIILWCFGIPLFALMMLLKHKQLILKEGVQLELSQGEQDKLKDFRIKYGFIINGFKTPVYFYEIIIQFRKVALIMVTVILSVVSPEIQALLSFLILSICVFYQHMKKPFLTAQLNKLEVLSLFVSTLTLYAGLYFITGQHYDYYQNPVLQWIFLLLLIIPNVLFFMYWLYHMLFELLLISHSKGRRCFCLMTLGFYSYERFQQNHEERLKKDIGLTGGQSFVQDHQPAEDFSLQRSNREPEKSQRQSVAFLNKKVSQNPTKKRKAKIERKLQKNIMNLSKSEEESEPSPQQDPSTEKVNQSKDKENSKRKLMSSSRMERNKKKEKGQFSEEQRSQKKKAQRKKKKIPQIEDN